MAGKLLKGALRRLQGDLGKFADTMPGPMNRSGYADVFKGADARLSGPEGDAVQAFVGHPHDALSRQTDWTSAFGIMSPHAFENIDHIESFNPLRDLLREQHGSRIPLMRVERPVANPDPRRNVFSWTSDPDFAAEYAGIHPTKPTFDERFIKAMEEEYARTGQAKIDNQYTLKAEPVFEGGPSYPQIYDRNYGHLTDTDSVRAFLQSQNEDRIDHAARMLARQDKIKATNVDLNDVLWATDRAGQSEFITRYPYGKYADGGMVPEFGVGDFVKDKIKGALSNKIRTHTGSPYKFDKFDSSKIGSGEGSAAYGHGFYSAENPAVAEEYRRITAGKGDSPGQWLINGVPDDLRVRNTLEALAKQHYGYWSPETMEATREIERLMAQGYSQDAISNILSKRGMMPPMDYEKTQKVIQGLPPGYSTTKPGWLYSLDINAHPGEFFDWDAPVDANTWNRIHPNVQDALNEAVENRGWNPFDAGEYKGHELFSGLMHHDVHDVLPPDLASSSWTTGNTDPKKHTSAYLSEVGFPGVRFLDKFSRRGQGDTRNYVVFPESSNLIDIVKREKAEGGMIDDPQGGVLSFGIGDFVKDRIKGKLSTIAKEAEGKPKTVKLPGGIEMPAHPIKELEEIAGKFADKQGNPYPIESFPKFDEDRARKIAELYEAMEHNPHDPVVRRAYEALIDETMDQYNALKPLGLNFEFLKPGEGNPYKQSPALGYLDLLNEGRMKVFPTEGGFGTLNETFHHPLETTRVGPIGDLPNATANDAFRIVHDIYGHYGVGNPFFRGPGEDRAWRAHGRLYSEDALPAATTELRGQNSWANYGPYGKKNRGASQDDTIYADQKVNLMPSFAWEDYDKAEGGMVRNYRIGGFGALSNLSDDSDDDDSGALTQVGWKEKAADAMRRRVDRALEQEKEINRTMRTAKEPQIYLAPDPKIQTVTNPERLAFPGIYKSPQQIIAEAKARYDAGDEEAMRRLFGYGRNELDEMSQARDYSNLLLVPHAYYPPPGATGSKNSANVLTNRNMNRIVDIAGEALSDPQLRLTRSWYEMQPLWDRMTHLGTDPAYQRMFNTRVGLHSAGASPVSEWNRGTAANWLAEAGRLEDYIDFAGVPEARRARMHNSFPRDMIDIPGHAYHSTAHSKPLINLEASGQLWTDRHKVPTYVQATDPVLADPRRPIADAHLARGVGYSDVRTGAPEQLFKELTTSEYGDFVPWWERASGKVDMQPRDMQAMIWNALGPQTGVRIIGPGKLEMLSGQIMKAAERLGVSPETARDLILTGKAGAYEEGGQVQHFDDGGKSKGVLSRAAENAEAWRTRPFDEWADLLKQYIPVLARQEGERFADHAGYNPALYGADVVNRVGKAVDQPLSDLWDLTKKRYGEAGSLPVFLANTAYRAARPIAEGAIPNFDYSRQYGPAGIPADVMAYIAGGGPKSIATSVGKSLFAEGGDVGAGAGILDNDSLMRWIRGMIPNATDIYGNTPFSPEQARLTREQEMPRLPEMKFPAPQASAEGGGGGGDFLSILKMLPQLGKMAGSLGGGAGGAMVAGSGTVLAEGGLVDDEMLNYGTMFYADGGKVDPEIEALIEAWKRRAFDPPPGYPGGEPGSRDDFMPSEDDFPWTMTQDRTLPEPSDRMKGYSSMGTPGGPGMDLRFAEGGPLGALRYCSGGRY